MIETERLELVPLNGRQLGLWIEDLPALEAELRCSCRAEPLEGAFLAVVRGQLEKTLADPQNDLWHSFWLLLRKRDRVVVGSADFKNVPAGGEVEIGYGLGKAFAHRGYMTEAVAAMCSWALAQGPVTSVTAETALDNMASQRVLQRCGFVEERRGESIWWRRTV